MSGASDQAFAPAVQSKSKIFYIFKKKMEISMDFDGPSSPCDYIKISLSHLKYVNFVLLQKNARKVKVFENVVQ